MREITVDTGILRTDISELRESLDNTRKQLEEMHMEIDAMNGMWKGEAHDEFVRQFTSDYENTKEFLNIVDSIIGCMQEAGKQYDACESEVHGIVDAIRI